MLRARAIGSRTELRVGMGLFAALVVAALLALPAPPSDGAIIRLKEARFEIHVKLEQSTEWRHVYQRCDPEGYQQGSQTIAARTPEEKPQQLRFTHYAGAADGIELSAYLTNSKGKPASYLVFKGAVNRSYFDSNEAFEGCEADPPPGSRDCGEKAIELALATVVFGEVRPPGGGKLKNRLSIDDEFLGANESYFAPYENCPIDGWAGLMPFHDGPLSPREVFGEDRKIRLRRTTADDGWPEWPSEYGSRTILESEITLKRIRKGRRG